VEVRTITDYLKQDPEWAKILSMDKNEVLLFIAERLETITMMAQGRYSGKITREEQKLYQEAWSYIDPKAKVCFTCGRSPQLMSAALLNFYQLQTESVWKRRLQRIQKGSGEGAHRNKEKVR
jgi:hypothetical protein